MLEKRLLMWSRVQRIQAAEFIQDLTAFFPSLSPDALLMLPNETVDAVTAACALRSYTQMLNQISCNSGGNVANIVIGKMAELRSGLREDLQQSLIAAGEIDMTRKFGHAVSMSDHSLMSMGMTRGKKTTDE